MPVRAFSLKGIGAQCLMQAEAVRARDAQNLLGFVVAVGEGAHTQHLLSGGLKRVSLGSLPQDNSNFQLKQPKSFYAQRICFDAFT